MESVTKKKQQQLNGFHSFTKKSERPLRELKLKQFVECMLVLYVI